MKRFLEKAVQGHEPLRIWQLFVSHFVLTVLILIVLLSVNTLPAPGEPEAQVSALSGPSRKAS